MKEPLYLEITGLKTKCSKDLIANSFLIECEWALQIRHNSTQNDKDQKIISEFESKSHHPLLFLEGAL